MKTYFLVFTADSEYNSSIKHIAETIEQAEEYLSADDSGWYEPKGTGRIEEVDCHMNSIKTWHYRACKCHEYFDYKTSEWKYLDAIDNQWKGYR